MVSQRLTIFFALALFVPTLSHAQLGGTAAQNAAQGSVALVKKFLNDPKYNAPEFGNFEKKSIRCSLLTVMKLKEKACVELNQDVINAPRPWAERVKTFQDAKFRQRSGDAEPASPYILIWDMKSASCDQYVKRKPALDAYESCMSSNSASLQALMGDLAKRTEEELLQDFIRGDVKATAAPQVPASSSPPATEAKE
jgi:hypothetical protein